MKTLVAAEDRLRMRNRVMFYLCVPLEIYTTIQSHYESCICCLPTSLSFANKQTTVARILEVTPLCHKAQWKLIRARRFPKSRCQPWGTRHCLVIVFI